MKSQLFRVIEILAIFFCPLVQAANIFCWLDFGSRSHLVPWKVLVLELANRGHQITFVGPKSDHELSQHANVTYAHLGDHINQEGIVNSTDVFTGSKFWNISATSDLSLRVQREAFKLPLVQDLIERKPKFDVAIISPLANDFGMYMAKEMFGAPIIFFFVGLKWPMMDIALGNPSNPAYVPSEYFNFGQHMTFVERCINAMVRLFKPLWDSHDRMAQLELEAQELLGLEEKPDLRGITDEVSFGLINSHPIFDGVRPLNQNTVEVGGIHVRPAKKIEDESLRMWLDDAREGFVYVSFGSFLTGSAMPKPARIKLVEAFMALKPLNIRILWKWESENIDEGLTDNIKFRKWIPQRDVLGHPNCKLFITQGGLMSTYESLYNAVPMIVMPGISDQIIQPVCMYLTYMDMKDLNQLCFSQFSNAARAEREGFGKALKWYNFTSETLLTSMLDVLSIPSYKQSAQKFSTILKDRPIEPLDLAVYHVEYVIRHGGAPFLRPPSKDLYWFQSLLIDICLLAVLLPFTILYSIYLFLRVVVTKSIGKAKKKTD